MASLTQGTCCRARATSYCKTPATPPPCRLVRLVAFVDSDLFLHRNVSLPRSSRGAPPPPHAAAAPLGAWFAATCRSSASG